MHVKKVVNDMLRLEFTKDEIDTIREKALFNKEELFIYDMMVEELSLKEMMIKLENENMHISSSTLSRRKKKIFKKIDRVISRYFI